MFVAGGNTKGTEAAHTEEKAKKKRKRAACVIVVVSVVTAPFLLTAAFSPRRQRAVNVMDPGTTILRVKRKRGTDPADALLLACKRIRAESSAAQPEPEPEHEHERERIENSVFKLVATVASQVMLTSRHANKIFKMLSFTRNRTWVT